MSTAQKNKKILIILLCTVIGMFAFGFALVPLYDIFCDITGINGKTANAATTQNNITADKSRIIRVRFLANNNEQLPWEFYPLTKQINIHPGEISRISYRAKNNSSQNMTIQAVPSVTPGYAARYLQKTQCFCFSKQYLSSGESIDMPVLFHIDPNIPDEITNITLSYTLFDISEQSKQVKTDG